ncbi:MAG: alcohol dehydrogenase catalytic domain-containing protein [Lachnospiraceae bacterium]|nr:alcohol dehydrogenase catalytic domain-containing protein [Lachnospiraceae bacterium]
MQIPEMMKAVYVVEPCKMEIREIPTPKLEKDTDVLVKVKAVGVCGSDLTAWKGNHPDMKMPSIPGHEMVGEVVAVGSAVTNVQVGDHVVREPIDYCGTCYACRHGRPNVCRDLKVWGFANQGGHREYYVSSADKVFKFDKDIPWEVAAMIEPYTIAAEVNDRAEVEKGDVVLIYGLGPAGISIADWAKAKGAVVIASDMVEKRLQMAKDFGMDYVFNGKEADVTQEVLKITHGEGPNVIIDAAGAPGIMDNAVDLISPAGRIVPVAFNFNPSPVVYAKVNLKEARISGSRLEAGKFPVVIGALKRHEEHIKAQITHTFPMEQVNEAFALAASRDPAVGKVVVLYE